MGDTDPLRVVDAGYRWVEDEREWLRGIAEAAGAFGVGAGVCAYTLDLAAAQPDIATYVGVRTDAAFEQGVRAFTKAFDIETARLMYGPTEFVGNALFRLRRLAHARKTTVDKLTRGTAVSAWALIGGDPRAKSVALVFPAAQKLEPDQPFPRARVLGLAAAHLAAAVRLRQLAQPSQL